MTDVKKNLIQSVAVIVELTEINICWISQFANAKEKAKNFRCFAKDFVRADVVKYDFTVFCCQILYRSSVRGSSILSFTFRFQIFGVEKSV